MASERETTVSNEGSSGLLFLPWSFLSWATTRIRPPRVSRWEGQRSFLSRGERRGVSRLCYVTRRHSSLPPPFPIIASLLPKIMYTLLYARSSFTARRIDESNDNIYFRVESGLLRSFSYTFSSSSYTLEKSFLRITKSAETLPTTVLFSIPLFQAHFRLIDVTKFSPSSLYVFSTLKRTRWNLSSSLLENI